MIYLLITNIVISICLCVNLILSEMERKRLIEMIASKDYVQYKNLENNIPEKEHKNMYKRRAEKENVYLQEGE